jgi:hypothetical protein
VLRQGIHGIASTGSVTCTSLILDTEEVTHAPQGIGYCRSTFGRSLIVMTSTRGPKRTGADGKRRPSSYGTVAERAERDVAIRLLHANGMSIAQIGRLLDVSKGTAHRVIAASEEEE